MGSCNVVPVKRKKRLPLSEYFFQKACDFSFLAGWAVGLAELGKCSGKSFSINHGEISSE